MPTEEKDRVSGKRRTSLGGEKMKERLTAEKTVLEGEEGYLIKQYHNGKAVAKQFVTKDCYEEFCNGIGQVPELIRKE